jgi:hypothetical protein
MIDNNARKTGPLLLAFLALYIGGYLVFRQARAETWAQDRQTYVIFSEGPGVALYYLWRPLSYLDYLWRPLSYLDGRVTGVGAHIGPHR